MAKIKKILKKAALQLIKVKYFLIILLLMELTATIHLIKVETKVKNHLAAWPWSRSAQTAAEAVIARPSQISQEIEAWEIAMDKNTQTVNALLNLALLNWQIYQNESAVTFLKQAFYLDPRLVSSLPLPFSLPQP